MHSAYVTGKHSISTVRNNSINSLCVICNVYGRILYLFSQFLRREWRVICMDIQIHDIITCAAHKYEKVY